MTRQLLLSVSPGELWAAFVADNVLTRLRVLRTAARGQPGEIFLGRVSAIKPELPAALVEIGLERPGFLSGEDAEPRGGIATLHQGQAIIVQVMKEARADKATGLSMRLRGHRPTKHIDRQRILDEAAKPGPVPRLLEAPATSLEIALGEFATMAPDEIVIDHTAALAELRHWLLRHQPAIADRIKLHRAQTPLFEHYGVSDGVAAALMARVPIKGGGAVTIEHTAAATLIDVDSGRSEGRRAPEEAALGTNLVAASEIARQIQLRSIAGPIIIDFIGMHRHDDHLKVQASLSAALAGDRDSEVLGWTRLGHLELVRKRRQAALAELLFERVPNGGWRKSALTIALEVLRTLAKEARWSQSGRPPRLHVNPEIAAIFETGARMARIELERHLGSSIEVRPEPAYEREKVDIRFT